MTLETRLKTGVPLSEFLEIKKAEQQIIEEVKSNVPMYNNMLCSVTPVMVAAKALPQLDEMGHKLFDFAGDICFWVVAVMAVFNIIKAAINGDMHKVGKIIIAALVIYGSVFIIPFALNTIRDVFQNA